MDAGARYDIDLRLGQKEGEFQQAILLANGVHVEVLADDGVVVPGQSVKVSVLVANNGATDVSVKQVTFTGFEQDAQCTLTAVTGGAGRGGGVWWWWRWCRPRRRCRPWRTGSGSSAGTGDFDAEEGSRRSVRGSLEGSRRRAGERALLAPER